MWLLTTAIPALLATFAWIRFRPRFRLELLCLMLWGATVMILVDHLLGYEGGPFLEAKTNGLMTDATLLGLVMLAPVFLIWGIALLRDRKKAPKITPAH